MGFFLDPFLILIFKIFVGCLFRNLTYQYLPASFCLGEQVFCLASLKQVLLKIRHGYSWVFFKFGKLATLDDRLLTNSGSHWVPRKRLPKMSILVGRKDYRGQDGS